MLKKEILRLHFIVFLWGFTAVLGKMISADTQNLVFYRMLFAAAFLFLYIRLFRKTSLKVSKKLLLQLIVIGSVMAFHWLCFFYAIKVSNVAIPLSCLSLSTLFAAFLEPVIFKRKIDFSEIIMGVIIVICIGAIFNAEFQYKEGIFFGLLTALLGTIFSVYNGKIFGKTDSANIIFYEMFSGAIVVALFMLFSGNFFHANEMSLKDFGLVLLLSGVFTAYPMLESVSLMKYISPFTLILTVNLEPIYGIILAFFIFGDSEKMSVTFYVASLVMILAIVANGILKAKKASKQLKTE